MGIFLNSKTPYTDYSGIVSDVYFVDKSELIAELIPALGKKERYFALQGRAGLGKVLWPAWSELSSGRL